MNNAPAAPTHPHLKPTMYPKTFLNIALAVALASAGSAFAQGNSRHERGNNGHGNNNECRKGNCAGPDQRERHAQPRYDPQPRMSQDMRRDHRGAGPGHSYYRGDRLPPQYRGRQYVVNDWRGHHLNAPPRGYHWVQSGGDYLLVAIATGVILQLLLSN